MDSAATESGRRGKRSVVERAGFALWLLIGCLCVSALAWLVLRLDATRTLLLHLGLSSVVTFAVFATDKVRSRKGGRRASELNLFLLAMTGGALGGLLAVHLLRHKTLQRRFTIGLPIIAFVHFVIVMLVLLA